MNYLTDASFLFSGMAIICAVARVDISIKCWRGAYLFFLALAILCSVAGGDATFNYWTGLATGFWVVLAGLWVCGYQQKQQELR